MTFGTRTSNTPPAEHPASRLDDGVMPKTAPQPKTDAAEPAPVVQQPNPTTGSQVAQLFDKVREIHDLHASAEALILGVADMLERGGAGVTEASQHLRQNAKQWGGAILANTPLGQIPNANVHA